MIVTIPSSTLVPLVSAERDCLEDVPGPEGDVARPGQHQRPRVVQAPLKLHSEDAEVKGTYIYVCVNTCMRL